MCQKGSRNELSGTPALVLAEWDSKRDSIGCFAVGRMYYSYNAARSTKSSSRNIAPIDLSCVVGTVIPSLSTVASASAQELAALEEQIANEGVKAIFAGTMVNPQVAEQLAADRGIKVVPIYTDSLSDANGPAPTYVEFMRFNLQTIVDALR
jgi:hypothetical protein